MPKLDVRGQQQAAPAAQQVQGAYGEGIGAAMLQVGQGLKSGAKAAMAGVDFFDMLGEQKARTATSQLSLDAEQKVWDIEHDSTVSPENREQEMATWMQGQIASRGKAFKGSGARLWTAQSAQMQEKYKLAARQSGRRTALNEMRAGVMLEADDLAALARRGGDVTQDRIENFQNRLAEMVELGAMESTEATRLRISTMTTVRAYTAESRELKAAQSIVDSVIDYAQEDPDAEWTDIRQQLHENHEEFSDPQIRDAAEADAKAAFENVRAERKRAETEQYHDAQLSFVNGEQSMLETLPNLTSENQVRFAEWSKDWKGFAAVQSDPETFNTLMGWLTSASPTERQKFYDTDLLTLADKLSKSDFDRFQSFKADAAQTGPEFLGGALSTFEARMRTKYPSFNTKKRAKLKAVFTQLAYEESQKLNRELTTEEVSALIDRALTPIERPGWFGVRDSAKPVAQFGPEVREEMIADPDEHALAMAHAAVENLFPSLEQGSDAYNIAVETALREYYGGLPFQEAD